MVNVRRRETWTRFRKGLCAGCAARCCTMPVEVRLQESGTVERFHARSGVFTLARRASGDCIYLDELTRRCTVYERRPDTCRNHPQVGGAAAGVLPVRADRGPAAYTRRRVNLGSAVMRRFVLLMSLGLMSACATGPAPELSPPARDLPVGTSLDPVGGIARAPAVPPAPQLRIAGLPVLGAADAPVTVVEFMDYECPYCQGYAQDIFPALKARYIDTGRMRYVLSNYPLPRHLRARPAAVAAACAERQGKFWEFHERLLAKDGGPLRDEDFQRHAVALRLDAASFGQCRVEIADGSWLDGDVAAAKAVGVAGTPSFFIGHSAGDIARGRLHRGAGSVESLSAAIDALLQ